MVDSATGTINRIWVREVTGNKNHPVNPVILSNFFAEFDFRYIVC